jgi:hypothetical protein
VKNDSLDLHWISDLARYEATFLQTSEPNFRSKIAWFNHSIKEIANIIAREDENSSPQRQLTLALWLRLGKKHRPIHLLFSLPSKAIFTASKR